MGDIFAELYGPTLKEVFTTHAREKLAQGADCPECARAYAQRGKPEFVLAYLLLSKLPEEEKREMLAYAYERRATLSEEKAEALQAEFHRTFPLIMLEVHKDHMAAQRVREGRPLHSETGVKIFHMS
ncbi:MAG: hypothetical protein ABI456_14600 [Ktedonobacteraceae bacterium]